VSRLLGVDLGTKRIGLAIAEPNALRARPLATLSRGRSLAADVAALGRVAGANGIGELVVGLPLDMAGGEGPAALAARAWAIAIADATGLPVTLRDERLSSHVAEGRVGPAKRGPSGGPPGPARRAANRARIDREAARVILEDELAARELGSPGERITPDRVPENPAPGASIVSGTLERPPMRSGGHAHGAPPRAGTGPDPHEVTA
jgi:putative transcription antitermination factor YqgF